MQLALTQSPRPSSSSLSSSDLILSFVRLETGVLAVYSLQSGRLDLDGKALVVCRSHSGLELVGEREELPEEEQMKEWGRGEGIQSLHLL